MTPRILLIALLGQSLLMAAPASAQMLPREVLPPAEIVASIRSLGLHPVTRPHWRGRHYVLHAVDRRGAEMRVIVDARFGEVISAVPVMREADVGLGRAVRGPSHQSADEIPAEPQVITGSVGAPPEKAAAKTPLPRPRPAEANAVAEMKSQPAPATQTPSGAVVSSAPQPQAQPAKASRDALPL